MLKSPDFHGTPAFLQTRLYRDLIASPLRIIDVGARDGVHELFLPLGKLAKVLAFEPDEEGFAELAADETLNGKMSEIVISPKALGDGTRQKFNLMTKATNNSLLRTNDVIVNRYSMELFRNVSHIEIDTHRLDDIIGGKDARAAGFGEIVKIDTQASEYMILSNAPNMLANTTVGVIAEVWFAEVYENQPLFHDLCALMTKAGLTFYGFTSFFLRSGKRLDKLSSLGRERALYADAIFLRDPFDKADGKVASRHFASLFVFAMITGYFDLALELIGQLDDPDEAEKLRATVAHFSHFDVDAVKASAEQAVAQLDPANKSSLLPLMRFIDQWRSYFDYGDVR